MITEHELDMAKSDMKEQSSVGSEKMALATPGRLNAELMKALVTRFPPERVIAHLERLMTATAVTKAGREIPDCRTQLAAIQLLLSYTVGKPVERQEIINVNVDPKGADAGNEEMKERLRQSPATRKALRAVLEEAEMNALI